MEKRAFKIQEFVAHSSNVKCLSIGKKSGRLVVSGGEDCKVNLWTVGKASSLLSLSGHSSSVDCVNFNSAEVLVLSGASSGAIKLWDLEESKNIRTLSGHRSNCNAVEFHPFGEFFASGSADTNLKLWDIRKKGCIHTYKGHARGVSTIKFTPDGRWVVSGGEDSVVKVWDLTAGKLLHEFKFHEGPIRCLDFHPLEFLLATGSADRTVNFWDLETFELIGSAGPEATGVRSMAFHPDGRTLFCGLDDCLKIFSWEPIICHDTLDTGWNTLGDLNIQDGKVLACSYYHDRIGVWAADVKFIEPYGDCPSSGPAGIAEGKFNQDNRSPEKLGSTFKSNFVFPANLHDYETTEIKNIYVDTTNSNKTSPKRAGPIDTPKIRVASESYDSSKPSTPKATPRREAHERACSIDTSKMRVASDSYDSCKPSTPKTGPRRETHGRTARHLTSRPLTPPVIVPRSNPSLENTTSFRRESITSERASPSTLLKPTLVRNASNSRDAKVSIAAESGAINSKTNSLDSLEEPKFRFSFLTVNGSTKTSEQDDSSRNIAEKFDKVVSVDIPKSSSHDIRGGPQDCTVEIDSSKPLSGVSPAQPANLGRTRSLVERWERREKCITVEAPTSSLASDVNVMPETDAVPALLSEQPQAQKEATRMNQEDIPLKRTYQEDVPVKRTNDPMVIPVKRVNDDDEVQVKRTNDVVENPPIRKPNDEDVIEGLMQSHDVFLGDLRSRLTKLQVVRHFWRRNDVKGGINAVGKLPDHSVQADVITVLVEKMEIVTLDLFSCLLPLFMSLLNSKVDRHTNVSLEMLLKLVAIFGPVIRSTVSASPSIGVDLQAEWRREYCNHCFLQLQKIKQLLPSVNRRGALLAKGAQELNLVLQDL